MELDQFIEKFGGMTEEYTFYGGQVTLRYDPKKHVYLLMTKNGLEVQDGVTSICHIIDKSAALVPWGCKMMEQKLLLTTPTSNGMVLASFKQYMDIVAAAKTAHKEKLEEAGNLGKIAHAWIEEYIKEKLDPNVIVPDLPIDERAKNACIAALTWIARHNVRWLFTERKVYSRHYKYAGTMDGLCKVDSCTDPNCCPNKFVDRLTIADWKSSNYLYPEYMLQTAAYMQAYREEMCENVVDRWVVRLGKDDAAFEAWHLEWDTYEVDFKAFTDALALSRSMATIGERLTKVKNTYKLAKKAVKAEALKLKCKKADKYKGQRKSNCGCKFCEDKYAQVQASKPPKTTKAQKAKLMKGAAIIAPDLIKSLQSLLEKP